MKIEMELDNAGQRIRLYNGWRNILSIEYDAESHRLFVWDMSRMDDAGPEITIDLNRIKEAT